MLFYNNLQERWRAGFFNWAYFDKKQSIF